MTHDLFSLEGRVALVTGAGSGLGAGIAEIFADYGAQVMIVDVDEDAAHQSAVSIGEAADFVRCDVTRPDDARAAAEKTISTFGKIDILVNNAGIGQRARAETMTDAQWSDVLAVNLNGAFHFCREVGRHMIERGAGGRIINMSSIAGVVGIETGNINYAASKGGLIALTRCLAIEWASHGILVNAIAPSHIRTSLIEKLMQDKPEVQEYFLNNIPLGRLGEVSDVTGPALFLASDAAAFITGHVLLVDGGHTAR